MDGVIFDSERTYIDCCVEAAKKYSIANVVETCHKCLGITFEDTKRILRETYGEEFPTDDFCHESMEIFVSKYSGGRLPKKDGAEDILKFLKENDFKVALASSTPWHLVEEQLSSAGLIDYFDEIVTGNMVERSKPNPDIFLKAAEKIGMDPSECAVIEDSFNGVRAGHAAGMFTIMVPDILQPDDEIRGLADMVLPSLYDVIKMIEE
jgi:HAD superfamily hydrolase (TIGR01509 family)